MQRTLTKYRRGILTNDPHRRAWSQGSAGQVLPLEQVRGMTRYSSNQCLLAATSASGPSLSDAVTSCSAASTSD